MMHGQKNIKLGQNNLNEVLSTEDKELQSSFTLRGRQQIRSCGYWAFKWNECLLLTQTPKYKRAEGGQLAW